MPKKQPTTPDLSGLDSLTMDNLLRTDADASQGKPLEIPLAEVVEDPEQPRTRFDEQSLKELADSIKRQGVLMPISVCRRTDGQPGYMIIAGARRYRAALLAGMNTIPAFIGNHGDKYAQMAENIHRDNLSHNEIAAFVAGELAQGKNQTQIAQALGKNKSYVSRYAALAEAPDWITQMVADGRCKDINIISSIIKRAEKDDELISKLASVSDVTKATLAALDAPAGVLVAQKPTKAKEANRAPASEPTRDHGQDNQGADQVETQASAMENIVAGNSLESIKAKQENIASEGYKEPVNNENSTGITVYVAGRKGLLKSKRLKIYFEDNGEIANVATEDVSFE